MAFDRGKLRTSFTCQTHKSQPHRLRSNYRLPARVWRFRFIQTSNRLGKMRNERALVNSDPRLFKRKIADRLCTTKYQEKWR